MKVSERALQRRINRKLAHQCERVSKDRRTGEYYHIDCYHNAVLGMGFSLEDFAREMGVLRQHEAVASQ